MISFAQLTEVHCIITEQVPPDSIREAATQHDVEMIFRNTLINLKICILFLIKRWELLSEIRYSKDKK